MSNTPAEQGASSPSEPEETRPVTSPEADPAESESSEPVAPAETLPVVEPVSEPADLAEPVDAEVVTEPVDAEVVAEPVDAELVTEPVDAEVVTEPVDAEVVAEPVDTEVVAEPVDAEVVPEPEPEPGRLSIDELEPEVPDAPDLAAVETPAPAWSGAATNLDLPSIELPHPAPEPARPAPPLPPIAPGAGGDYAQNLAQSAYGQPTPQPSPAPQPPPPPPYAPTAYGTPTGYGQPQYSQPAFGQQGYQQGYGLVPASQMSAAEESTWSSAAHWSSILLSLVSLPFLGPLLIMLIQGPKSARVRANAAESLNFDITMIIAMIVSLTLMIVVIGFITTPILAIYWLVMKIVAAVQTSNGQDYRYPATIRLVK